MRESLSRNKVGRNVRDAMAIYTDFFLASPLELQNALPLRVPPTVGPPWEPSKPFSRQALAAEFPTDEEAEALKMFEMLPQKNLTPDLLEELHLSLGGDEDKFSAAFGRPPFMVPGEDPFGGIFQLPAEFVHALADLPRRRLEGVAKEWLGDKKAKPALVGLWTLAKKAISENKNMYLWMVL
jgi:hypothetical protein